jgi:hypothetical protein
VPFFGVGASAYGSAGEGGGEPEGELDSFFRLTTTAASGTYPFTIGMGFAKGESESVTTDLPNAQVKIKRTWDDGTVKHAIISGRAALTEDVPLTVNLSTGTQSEGAALTASDIETADPEASVQCGAFGTVDLGDLLASPVRTWVSGSEMVECHYRADVGGGTLLSVWFHVRLYADDRVWIRAIVENGYLDNGAGSLAANANRSYVPTLIIGGVTVYNNGGASLTHYQNTRYSAEGWIGGDPQVTPGHDVAYLRSSKLLPNYHWTDPSDATLDGLTQTYTQMGRGDLEESMGAAGFQESIGLLPKWDALYSTSGDARAFRSSLANSSHLNSYGIVWRDKTTNLAPKPSAFSTWSIEGPGGTGSYTVSRGTLTWEFNHMPSEGYLAYLVTGDYWHYETLLLHNALCYLTLSSGGGGAGRGNGTSRIMIGETRGTGWAIRNMVQLAGIYPTGDAVAGEYQTLLSNNIDHWKDIIDGLGGVGLGYLYEYNLLAYDPGTPGVVAPWMQHFNIQSLGFGYDLEPLASMTNYVVVRDWSYRGAVGILGDGTGFCFTRAYAYNARITDVEDYDPSTWFDTWAEVFSESLALALIEGGSSCENTLLGSSGGIPTDAAHGFWGNLMPAAAYAVDHAASGAADSWARFTEATNWSDIRDSGFDDTPNWGITPRSWSDSSVLPAWRVGQAVGEWREITGSELSGATTYNYGASNAPQGKQDAWIGWHVDTRTSKVYSVANGGHDDYWGNEVDVIDLMADSPAWTELLASSLQANVTSNDNHYADGRPVSRHSYYTPEFIENRDRAFLFGVGSGSKVGNPKYKVDAFNILTNTYDAADTHTQLQFGAISGGGWAVSKHPTTEDVYIWNENNRVDKWTESTGAWSTVSVGSPPVTAQEAASAIDPNTGLMFVAGGTGNISYTFNTSSGAFVARTLSGAEAANVTGAGRGMIFEPELGVFLWKSGASAGGDVIQIDPDTWEATDFATTGGGSLPAAAAVAGGNRPVYKKFLYVPALSGVVYCPAWGENLWFLRTH